MSCRGHIVIFIIIDLPTNLFRLLWPCFWSPHKTRVMGLNHLCRVCVFSVVSSRFSSFFPQFETHIRVFGGSTQCECECEWCDLVACPGSISVPVAAAMDSFTCAVICYFIQKQSYLIHVKYQQRQHIVSLTGTKCRYCQREHCARLASFLTVSHYFPSSCKASNKQNDQFNAG